MKHFILSAAAIFGLLAFVADAQTLAINDIMNLGLNCQVQQDMPPNASTTNLEINTQSLLELIAADQGFTLPPHPKLWLSLNNFSVLRQDNTIFTNIDTNILSIAYVNTVLKSKLTQTQNRYMDTIDGTSIVTLIYNGSTISFTLNIIGEQSFYNEVNFSKTTNNAIASTSFSGHGFGTGTCGGQNIVVTGFLLGNYSFRYTAGGTGGSGAFPGTSTGGNGAFPGTSTGGNGAFPGASAELLSR